MSRDSSRAPRSVFRTGSRTDSDTSTRSRNATLGQRTRRGGRTARRRVSVWWRRNRRQLRRRWRRASQIVTPTGRFVLGATILCFVLGASFGWVELLALGIAGAALIVFGVPFLLGSRTYLIRLVLDRTRVVAGGSVTLTVDVENSGHRPALPALAELPVGEALREQAIPFIGPRGRTMIPVAIPATRRGVIEVGPVALSRRDPLGLMRREVTWKDRHLVHVHPETIFLPPGAAGMVRDLDGMASRKLTDSDLSFHAVRDYSPGDAMRHVHWRSTAKTGMLMVRQYEESQTAHSAVLFDANRQEYASEEEFELGVSVAASVALQAVRDGRERFVASQWATGRIRTSIEGLEEMPSQTSTTLLDAWAALAPAAEAQPIEWLARGLAESRRPLSVVVVVTGSLPEPARLRRAAVAFPRDVAVLMVKCELLADPAAKLLDVCTLFTVGALGDLPQLMLRGSRS